MKKNWICRIIFGLSIITLANCGGGSSTSEPNVTPGVSGPNVWGNPDTFRGAGIINDPAFLIGGPVAVGQTGDVLLQNDQARFIIREPGRMAGIQTYGGNIVDADLFRPSSEGGFDHFGFIYPLVNIGWTTNCQSMEIINAEFDNGPVTVRCTGKIDVYDYIMTTVIEMFTNYDKGVTLHYDDRFNDILNPFDNVPELRNISEAFVTDYTLYPDKPYLRIDTYLENLGGEPVPLPFGDWINGSGNVEMFVPNGGFHNSAQMDRPPALIYGALQEDTPVSYGYFYDLNQYVGEDQNFEKALAAGMQVSGVSILVLGEETLLNLLPAGGSSPKISNILQPGVNTFTRFFVVGDGDIASVMDAGYEAVGVSTWEISGKVKLNGGQAVEKARIIVLNQAESEENRSVVTVVFTDNEGNFKARVPSATYPIDKVFGSGNYLFEVYKEGYHQSGTALSGTCTNGQINQANLSIDNIECTLGATSTINVAVQCDGKPCPARLTIVGFDPSDNVEYKDAGRYGDLDYSERPYGVVDLLYIDPYGEVYPKGNPRVSGKNSIKIEPGDYEIYFTRGPEYSVDSQSITLTPGSNLNIQGSLSRVLETPGYVSGDYHIHDIKSPDSPFPSENRIRALLAEGLDTAAATNHEVLTDYQPLIEELGYANEVFALTGQEVTLFSSGHSVVLNLKADPTKRLNGAYDYTYISGDEDPNFGMDINQSIEQIFITMDDLYDGTQVLSVAHPMHPVKGNFSIMELVTTNFFDDVTPLSTYRDPITSRLPPNTNSANNYQAPYPFGTSEGVPTSFTSMGLTAGQNSDTFKHLEEMSLPVFFNWLNLGKKASATSNSDSHSQLTQLLGEPRNYVASSIDPRDGIGTFSEIDPEEIAKNINAGRVIVSNGLFINARLKSESVPEGVEVGGTITGTGKVTLDIEVLCNEYLDFSEVRVFANTVPVPYKDDMSGPWDGNAVDFHNILASHQPRYELNPLYHFHKNGDDDEKLITTVENGVRRAKIEIDLDLIEDTWIIILANGEHGESFSTFPMVAKNANKSIDPEDFLETLKNDRINIGGTRPFGFTNPFFVDIDGDGFEAIYVANGTSPLLN